MSLVEVLNELKRIRGKFLREEGIYIFSKLDTLLLSLGRISTTPYETSEIDFSAFRGPKLFFISNKQDTSIVVEFLTLPYSGGPEVTIKPVTIDPNTDKLGLMLSDPHAIMKLRFRATSPPTSGEVFTSIVRWGM